MSEATLAASPAETTTGKSSSPNVALFLISVLGLYLELLLIRWVGTEVRIFAYLQNTVLVVCFLGLGMGCWTCRKPIVLRDALVPLTFLVALLSIPQTRWGLGQLSEMLSAFSGLLIWSPGQSRGTGETIFFGIVGLTLTFLLMMLIWDIFVPIGRLLGRLMDDHPWTIQAYSVNVAGSLIGIWLFVLLSALNQPPMTWFLVAGVMLLYFIWENGKPKTVELSLLAVCVGFAWLAGFAPTVEGLASWRAGEMPAAVEVNWSPYQKLLVRPPRSDIPWDPDHNPEIGTWVVDVNNVSYQEMVDLDVQRLKEEEAKAPHKYPAYMKGLSQYDLPARFHGQANNMLIVGAGSGNDAAGALRQGVRRVVAVDIDPIIIDIGKRYHAEKPYQNPAVEVVNDDARSYFATTSERFDVINFGLLDSHTTTSMTNARLDHYVYTRESIERAKELLADGGVLVLSFYVQREFIGDRINRVLQEVFQQEPIVFSVPNTGYGRGAVLFVAGDLNRVRGQLAVQPDLKVLIDQRQAEVPIQLPGTTPIATDDWPYLYLEQRSIPFMYVFLAVLLLLLVVRGLRRLEAPGLFRNWERTHWHFFFLGAAFMLLEVQNISKAAVVLGNTWLVNAVIISSILSLILLANLIVSRFPQLPLLPIYVLLCGSCLGLYFVDISRFAFLPYATKAAVVGGLTSLPMLFSGIVFIRSFAVVPGKDTALGANLLGALVGGLLQTITFVTGIKALLLIVAGLYLMALATRPAPSGEQAVPEAV